MIRRKKKICKGCGRETYIFARGLCKYCYGKQNMPKWGKSRLKRTMLAPRSDKRAGQEKEYVKLRKVVIAEQYNCFFCGEEFRKNYKPDIHHLKGRDNDLLTEKKYLVAVHRKCHRDYHDKSRCEIDWFPMYLVRLKQKDFELWHHEMWLSEK